MGGTPVVQELHNKSIDSYVSNPRSARSKTTVMHDVVHGMMEGRVPCTPIQEEVLAEDKGVVAIRG